MIAALAAVLLQTAPTTTPVVTPVPAPARGQIPAGPEWISAEDEDVNAAVLMYGGGLSLSVLCRDERLSFLIGGLTPSDQETRTLQVNAPSDDLQNSTWIVGSDLTTAISVAPAVYARRLRSVHTLTVRIPGGAGTPGRRYELPIPSSHETLDAVLTGCAVPVERVEDAIFDPELPTIRWIRLPTPNYPDAGQRSSSAAVTLDCLSRVDGTLTDCEIVTEEPPHQGFGAAALASVRAARLGALGGRPLTTERRFKFIMRFSMTR